MNNGQMCWLSGNSLDYDGEKILYVRLSNQDTWKPYYQFQNLVVPDYQITGLRHGNCSKGFATMQKLLRLGFSFVPTAEAEKILPLSGNTGDTCDQE